MIKHLSDAHIFITGGLGFIGSQFVRQLLLSDVALVTVYDNREKGLPNRLVDIEGDPRLSIVRENLLNLDALTQNIKEHNLVIHLGANTNMRAGQIDPRYDIEAGFNATMNVIEAMRCTGVQNLLFASSSAVYGTLAASAVSENQGPLLPISTYGAAKLAAEGWISSYCHLFGLHSRIFRFGNVIGSGMDHGLIYDVADQLSRNPNEINILGDGRQGRTYVLVNDCIEAILFILSHSDPDKDCDVFNITGKGVVTTVDVVHIVAGKLGLKEVEIKHQGRERGWRGDVSVVELDLHKVCTLGWQPKDSKFAVAQAAEVLIKERN